LIGSNEQRQTNKSKTTKLPSTQKPSDQSWTDKPTERQTETARETERLRDRQTLKGSIQPTQCTKTMANECCLISGERAKGCSLVIGGNIGEMKEGKDEGFVSYLQN